MTSESIYYVHITEGPSRDSKPLTGLRSPVFAFESRPQARWYGSPEDSLRKKRANTRRFLDLILSLLVRV